MIMLTAAKIMVMIYNDNDDGEDGVKIKMIMMVIRRTMILW